jgi:hypothetical protein
MRKSQCIATGTIRLTTLKLQISERPDMWNTMKKQNHVKAMWINSVLLPATILASMDA